jgi:hypothetical protein
MPCVKSRHGAITKSTRLAPSTQLGMQLVSNSSLGHTDNTQAGQVPTLPVTTTNGHYLKSGF